MKLSIALAATALLATAFTTASTHEASAVIYCSYIRLSGRLHRKARRGAARAAGCARGCP